jgi:sugar/nucleoside kinase (ribokinase family)
MSARCRWDHAIFRADRNWHGGDDMNGCAAVAARRSPASLAAATRASCGRRRIPSRARVPGRVIDTLGAGDIFHGAYTRRWRTHSPLSPAPAAIAAGRAGAPTRAEVDVAAG